MSFYLPAIVIALLNTGAIAAFYLIARYVNRATKADPTKPAVFGTLGWTASECVFAVAFFMAVNSIILGSWLGQMPPGIFAPLAAHVMQSLAAALIAYIVCRTAIKVVKIWRKV